MNATGFGYRRLGYRPVPAWQRWWPLAHKEFAYLFRSKWGVAVFCACMLPLIVKLFVLMVRFGVVNFGGMRANMIARADAFAAWDPMRAHFYVETVVTTFPGLPLLVMLTATVTAGAVARDRMTNALELLWTRGISPLSYLLAKWVGATLLLALVTVAAPLVLWSCAVLFAEDWTLLQGTVAFMPGLLGGLLLVTMTWTAICVLISSLSSQTSQATVTWCILMIGSSAVANVMAAVFREPAMKSYLSLWDAGGVVARWCAGVGTRGAPVIPAIVVMLTTVAVLGLLARRRLLVTEAVG